MNAQIRKKKAEQKKTEERIEKEKITSAWVLEHDKNFNMDIEKWRAELRVVKGGHYL